MPHFVVVLPVIADFCLPQKIFVATALEIDLPAVLKLLATDF